MNIIGIIGLAVAFIGVALTGLGVFFIFKDGSATTSRSVFWTISGAVVLLLAFILMIVAVIFKRRDLTNKKQKVEKRIKVVKERVSEEIQDLQRQQQQQQQQLEEQQMREMQMLQKKQQEEERKNQLMMEEYIAALKDEKSEESEKKPDFGYVHVPGNFTEGPLPEKGAAETMEKIRKEMKHLQKEIAAQKEKNAQLEKAHAKEREKRKFNELKSTSLRKIEKEKTKNTGERIQALQSQPSAGSFNIPGAPQNLPILGQLIKAGLNPDLINAGLNPDLINAVLQNIPLGNSSQPTRSEPNVMAVAPSPVQPSTSYNSPASSAPSPVDQAPPPPSAQPPFTPPPPTPVQTSTSQSASPPPSTPPPLPPQLSTPSGSSSSSSATKPPIDQAPPLPPQSTSSQQSPAPNPPQSTSSQQSPAPNPSAFKIPSTIPRVSLSQGYNPPPVQYAKAPSLLPPPEEKEKVLGTDSVIGGLVGAMNQLTK